MSDQLDEVLTIGEIDAYLKAGKRTAHRLDPSGKFPAFELRGSWRFRCHALEQWIASRMGKSVVDDDKGTE